MLPDLLTENVSGSWTIHIANVKAGFVPMEPLSRSPLAVPHSSAFVDLLEAYAAGDCAFAFYSEELFQMLLFCCWGRFNILGRRSGTISQNTFIYAVALRSLSHNGPRNIRETYSKVWTKKSLMLQRSISVTYHATPV